MGQCRLKRVRERRCKEEEAEVFKEEDKEVGGVEARLNNPNTETADTEEEAADVLEVALGRASQDMEVEEDGGRKGEDEGKGTKRAMGALEFLTQEAELIGTMLVDARNGFNKMSLLEMMLTVRHRWPAGARFAFNRYRNWAQLLLRQLGDPTVTILSREGVTEGEPLSMVLYGITLVPLAEELRAADPGLLSPFYKNDVVEQLGT